MRRTRKNKAIASGALFAWCLDRSLDRQQQARLSREVDWFRDHDNIGRMGIGGETWRIYVEQTNFEHGML